MEFSYENLKETRRKELDSIKTQYIKTKIIPPKRSDVKPLFCVVWQAGRVRVEEKPSNKISVQGTMVERREVDSAFDDATQSAFDRNIIIGYLFCNQDAGEQEQEYVFHYSPSGIERARQLDESNKKNGVDSNSFFNSFLYRKLFRDENEMYVSRGGIFPVFKEKLMALRNRRDEILEESSRTGKSVLQISTSDISNDLVLIGAQEGDIERYYRETIKSYYSTILARKGVSLEIDDFNVNTEKRRAEKELKRNVTDLVY